MRLTKPEFLAYTLWGIGDGLAQRARQAGARLVDERKKRMSWRLRQAPPRSAETTASGSSFYTAMRILPRAQARRDVRDLFLLPRRRRHRR